MVLEAEQVDERDEEIFRLQQLLYAAETKIDWLESKLAKPKKYRMSKKESQAWDRFVGYFDVIQADEYNLFHIYQVAGLLVKDSSRAGHGCWKRSELQEEIRKMWSLGMDLHHVSIYGDDPRNPSDSRYANCFCAFEQSINRIRKLYSALGKIDERHANSMIELVDKAIEKYEELKHWGR